MKQTFKQGVYFILVEQRIPCWRSVCQYNGFIFPEINMPGGGGAAAAVDCSGSQVQPTYNLPGFRRVGEPMADNFSVVRTNVASAVWTGFGHIRQNAYVKIIECGGLAGACAAVVRLCRAIAKRRTGGLLGLGKPLCGLGCGTCPRRTGAYPGGRQPPAPVRA